MTFTGADERSHAPGPAAGWCEAWQLDAASDDGAGLSVRLALFPARGVAWWWTHLLLPGVDGVVVVRDHEVGLPRQGLEIRADGLWAELTCEVPFEHWTYGLEAFGVRLDAAAESLHGEIGERLPVGFGIEWEVDDAGAVTERANGPDGYEQFGRVHGEILLGRASYELDAVGLRSHAWGGSTSGFTGPAAWMRAPGFARRFDVGDTRVETKHGADGLPVAVRYVTADDLEIAGEVLGSFAVPPTDVHGPRSTLVRALCRYAVQGAAGAASPRGAVGWSSWLLPA